MDDDYDKVFDVNNYKSEWMDVFDILVTFGGGGFLTQPKYRSSSKIFSQIKYWSYCWKM